MANQKLIQQQYAFNLIRNDTTIFKQIPQQLKTVLTAENAPKHWCIILMHNNHASFYSNYSSQHWLDKQQRISNMLTKIIAHGNVIPNGYYAFSMEDGVHTEYSWPLLAFASNTELVTNKNVVLIPDFEAMQGYQNIYKKLDLIKNKYSWQKKIASIFWRGNASGAEAGPAEYKFPRLQFLQTASRYPNIIDAKFTKYPKQTSSELQAYLNKYFPINHTTEIEEALKYRYLFDVDGYSCSYSRMAWILYSDSLLFKHKSTKQQWYYSLLQPFVHYIPIKEDFSDLEQQYLWAENNKDQAQQIVHNAQILAKQVFSEQAIEQATIQALMDYHALTQN